MNDVDKFLVTVFCDICELDDNDFGINDPLESCVEWSSLTLLSLLAEIDDKYGITISSNKVDDLKTLKDYSEYIQKAI